MNSGFPTQLSLCQLGVDSRNPMEPLSKGSQDFYATCAYPPILNHLLMTFNAYHSVSAVNSCCAVYLGNGKAAESGLHPALTQTFLTSAWLSPWMLNLCVSMTTGKMLGT